MATQNKFPLSYSRINTFKQCPKKFEHENIIKDVEFETSDAAEYGNRVHAQLELYGKSGDESSLTGETRRWKALVDYVLGMDGEASFEQRLGLTGGLRPCGWFDKNIWLRFILDVLVVNGDKALVMDWKTGNVRPDMMQLELFAFAVMAVYPEVNTVHTAFAWLVHDDSTRKTYKRSEMKPIWGKAHKHMVDIQEAIDLGVFPAKPSPLCGWCPARHTCIYR